MIKLAMAGRDFARTHTSAPDAGLQVRIERTLSSAAMRALRSLLDRVGLTIERTPILCKYLSRRHLRVMFPVRGGTFQRGTVVSIVCLYDCVSEETLYAHPMHAGPDVNPLLKHRDGPMAAPMAQPGKDGDRATARLIAHKEALWQRYLADREVMGPAEASLHWRRSYYWALKRLYFCTRCSHCTWGTPFFDGPDPDAPPKVATYPISSVEQAEPRSHVAIASAVVAGEAWNVEAAYARRGGFSVSQYPRVLADLGDGFLQLIFPTNAALIQGGTLVAVAAVYSRRRRETLFAHCLSAGPEPEIQFLSGDEALGLPQPRSDGETPKARANYVAWRREAWSRFWLDELEHGIALASKRWLRGFWIALRQLFGVRDIQTPPSTPRFDRVESYDGGIHDAPASCSSSGDGTGGAPHVAIARNTGTGPSIPFETLQNTGGRCFVGHATQGGSRALQAVELATLTVNLGRRCNQSCGHCHVDAGPHRREEMSRETVELVVGALRRHAVDTLDITGGAPEMNPHFRYLASTASQLCRRVVDRCNLTILLEPGYEDLPRFLARHDIEIIASLPCYRADNVDRQRGRGTFEKSMAALRILNELGYGESGTKYILNLVYNPLGADLAPSQTELEERFKDELLDRFGVRFNRLLTMNNMPINRFRDYLVRNGQLGSYMDRLVDAFNPATVDGLMCRHALSVGWDGRLYDCDFNQVSGIPLGNGLPRHIRDFDASVLRGRTVNTAAHCFGCAAGAGSSCNGALT